MASAVNYEVPSNLSSNKVVYYSQGQQQIWSDKSFGGGTIASSGCSVTSLAMCISYLLGTFILPDNIVESIANKYGNYNHYYVEGKGQSWEIFSGVASLYQNITCKEIASSYILTALQNRHPIIMSCRPGEFTNGGHFIVLTGTCGQYIRVNDPSHPDKSFKNYTLNDIVKNGKNWWEIGGGISSKYGSYDGKKTYSSYPGGALDDNTSETYSGRYGKFGSQQNITSGKNFEITPEVSTISNTFTKQTISYTFEDKTIEIDRDSIIQANSDILNSKGGSTNLLSYPTLVETPFILFKVGAYTFGKYTRSIANKITKIDFPNYIDSLTVTKYSGELNTYTINLDYQVTTGDDPNLLDKIFSKVGYGKVYISYGDYSSPTFIYKEEEAIITNISTTVDFSSSNISYVISCTSTSALLQSSKFNFPARTSKPSDIILELLKQDSIYHLSTVFTGMGGRKLDTVLQKGYIATDDQEVEIEAKLNFDVISYINYLVTCMKPIEAASDSVLVNATYHMCISDDIYNDDSLGGTYFKIIKINTNTAVISDANTYELDIGFPTDNQVMQFSINTNNSQQLLYSYSDELQTSHYTYSIDNDGNLVTEYSPNMAISSKNFKMTSEEQTWWTNMTEFPISATVTMKGLIRSAILMTYIKVNALMYGQKHTASGIYIITGQRDVINASGYRTELALTKVAGDDDYIQKTKQVYTQKVATGIQVNTETVEVSNTITNLFRGLSNAFYSIGNFTNNISTGITNAAVNLPDISVNTNILTDDTPNQESYNTSGIVAQQIDGKRYSLSTDSIMRIAAAMCTEQGFGTDDDSLTALKWETSLLCNIYEKYRSQMILKGFSKATLLDLIFSGSWNAGNRSKFPNLVNCNLSSVVSFFASTAANAAGSIQGVGIPFNFSGTYSGSGTIRAQHMSAVEEVLDGNRYTNATEQGSDFGKLWVNGITLEGRSAVKKSKTSNPELWIKNKTKLQVVWSDGSTGQVSTFVGFPADNPKFDAFAIV